LTSIFNKMIRLRSWKAARLMILKMRYGQKLKVKIMIIIKKKMNNQESKMQLWNWQMFQAQQVHIFWKHYLQLKKKIGLKGLEKLKKISKIDTMSSILLILSKKKNLKNLLEMSFPAGRINNNLLILNSKYLLIFLNIKNKGR
jgi:hypothetical protein